MRKLIFHFIVSLCTFTIGVILSSSFALDAVISTTASIDEISNPIELVSLEVGKICEVHGIHLKKQSIQRICGQYKGRTNRGGHGTLNATCSNSKQKQMSLDDTQFFFNLAGGMNTWLWWEDYGASKKTHFPHGYDWQYEDCDSIASGCKEIEFCPKCRASELTWKRESANN